MQRVGQIPEQLVLLEHHPGLLKKQMDDLVVLTQTLDGAEGIGLVTASLAGPETERFLALAELPVVDHQPLVLLHADRCRRLPI